MRYAFVILLAVTLALPLTDQNRSTETTQTETISLLNPASVFDGTSAQLHRDWVVVVRGEKIESVGPPSSLQIPAGAKTIDLPGLTLLPGLIEAPSHILLHPYSETVWNDQVAKESLS